MENNIPFSVAYKKDRAVLKDVLPIAVPMCVSIEASNICNFKCIMCFQGREEFAPLGGPFQNMSGECFDKVIMDLAAWTRSCGKIKIVKLYSTGEPLVNPQICERLRRIKQADICEKVEITTNASLLTKDIAEKLVEYGLDYLRISVYSVDEQNNRRITRSRILPEEILANVRYVREYRDSRGKSLPFISAKMIDTYTEENDRFMEMYKDVADETYIDKVMNSNTGENVIERLYEEKAGQVNEEIHASSYFGDKRKACRYPFTHMTIRSDGGVVVCCSDWMQKTKYGNVLERSLEDIWNSRELYDFRCMTLRTKGMGNEICRKCEIPLRDLPEDDVDGFPVEKLSYRE